MPVLEDIVCIFLEKSKITWTEYVITISIVINLTLHIHFPFTKPLVYNMNIEMFPCYYTEHTRRI